MKLIIIIIILGILLLIAGGYISYTELIKWSAKVYNQGVIAGQISIAMQQLQTGQIVFSNGTSVRISTIEELCSGGQG